MTDLAARLVRLIERIRDLVERIQDLSAEVEQIWPQRPTQDADGEEREGSGALRPKSAAHHGEPSQTVTGSSVIIESRAEPPGMLPPSFGAEAAGSYMPSYSE